LLDTPSEAQANVPKWLSEKRKKRWSNATFLVAK
jgi:hypothetical protein